MRLTNKFGRCSVKTAYTAVEVYCIHVHKIHKYILKRVAFRGCLHYFKSFYVYESVSQQKRSERLTFFLFFFGKECIF